MKAILSALLVLAVYFGIMAWISHSARTAAQSNVVVDCDDRPMPKSCETPGP